MALSKDFLGFGGQVSFDDAYHKITRLEIVAEGSGPLRVSCVVSCYKDRESSDDSLEPLNRDGMLLRDLDENNEHVQAIRSALYEAIKNLESYSSAEDVIE